MKLKTFILTFLMMSCSIVFGQGTYSESAKTEAQIMMHLANDEVGTITIANNISIGNTIEIPNGRKVTIDLNGHELSTNQEIYIFKNFGKLTITDSDTEGKGTIIAPLGIYNGKPQTRTISTDINYNAQLTINGGIFVSTSSNVSAAIHNHLGVVNIRGGEFYGEYSAITNYGMANIENAYIECLNRDNGAAAIINDFEIEYGENVRIVGRYTTATETGVITPSDYEPTYLFAELNGTNKYPSLQEALDACTTGDNTINLLFHNSADATVSQKEGVNITIDGNGYKGKQFEYTGTIYVDGNNRSNGEEKLTIQDINFTTKKDSHDFISANVAKQYAHNVTVQNCDFTATEASAEVVALRFRQSYNINVVDSKFTNLFSAMWATGGSTITVDGITATNCKEGGISVGTATPVYVKNSTIAGAQYGVRADGSGDYSLTVENSTLEAEVPVIVRNTTGGYSLTVQEDATLIATNNGPQVVVTEKSDNADYVTPTSDVNVTLYDNVTSTFGLTAKIGNAFYATLQDAVDNAETGEIVTLIADNCKEDVTVTQAPDYVITIDGAEKTFKGTITVDGKSARYETTALTIKNVNFDATEGINYAACINLGVSGNSNTRYTNNVTVDNCTFVANISDEVPAVKSYTGGDWNLKINNCTVNEGMHSLAQVTNVEKGMLISGCKVYSKNGINLNSSAGVVVENSTFETQGYAVRVGVNGGTSGAITLNNNTLKSACEDGDAVIIVRGAAVTQVDLSMTENVVSGTTHISGNTAATKIAADENYWDGKEAPVATTPIVVNSYYSDKDLTTLVRNEMGSINAFVSNDRITGDVTTNAKESIKIEIIGKDGNVIGSSSLENLSHATGFNKQLTWRINLGADDSGSWAMTWNEGAPSIDNMPAKVKLYVDAKEGDAAVAEAEIKYTANGDGTSPVFAAKTDANGKINSFIACEGKYNLNEANTFLANALTAGDNVAITVAGTYAVPTGKNLTITGAVDGVRFGTIGEVGMGGANVTFNNVTFDYATDSHYKGLQHSGNLVYNNCTFNGQVFLYGASETFNKCTFNQTSSDYYNVWTYSAEHIAFNDCIFYSAGKSVLIYRDNTPAFVANVSVNECEFHASSAVTGKAAIEMDSSIIGGINLTIDDKTTATGFGNGNVSGNSLWNNKKGNNDDANNDITVVVAGETVLEPIYVAKRGEERHRTLQEAIDKANSGETIELLANCDEAVHINKTNVAIIIDGKISETEKVDFSGVIGINIGQNVTIRNIDFKGATSNHNFIKNEGSPTGKNYNTTLLVENGSFTGNSEFDVVGVRTTHPTHTQIVNCTADGLHSLLQNTGGQKITVDNVVITDGKEGGLSTTGTRVIEIKNSEITAKGYGVRIDAATADAKINIESSKFNAYIPVYARNATAKNVNFTFSGENTMTQTNEDNVWFVIENVNSGYHNGNVSLETLVTPTGQVLVTLNDENLNPAGIHGVVAKIGNVCYPTLQTAIDAAKNGDVVTLVADVTEDEVLITQKADVNVTIDGNNKNFTGHITIFGSGRHTGAETLTIKNVVFNAVEGKGECIASATQINGVNSYAHNVTIEGCTFNGNDTYSANNTFAIRFPSGGVGYDLTVKDCTADNKMFGLLWVTQVIGELIVDNCTAEGVTEGIVLTSTTNATITNTTIDASNVAIRAGQAGVADGTINNFTFNNNTLKSDNIAIQLRGNATDANLSMEENVVSGATHISGHTKDTQLSVDANYWDGEENPVADPAIRVNSYYADAELQNLVHNYHGDNFIGYTDEFKIWGEVWGNAFESFVIKVLDKNGEVMGTTSLNDVDGFIDGDVTATWSLLFDVASNSDPYWTMSWTSRPTVANMPASVELYVDGHKVGEGPVQLNNPDNLEKKTVAIVDNDGYIKVFYASFDQAYKASKTGDVLELLETAVITNTSNSRVIRYSSKNITVKANFGGTAFRVQSGNEGYNYPVVYFGGMTIESNDYCIIVGAEDSSIGADVEIQGGTYNGVTSAISVTKGNLRIVGGTFQVEPYEGSYEYTINCIDANYNNNTAEVSINGGKFYNFNPQDNAAEGIGTNFLTGNYAAVVDADGWYTVGKAYAQIDNKYYATLQDAINAATDGQTVKLTRDITEDVNISKLEKSITIDGDDYDNKYKKMKGLSIGSDDNKLDAGVVTIKNIAFNGKGLSVKELANVTIQDNTFTDITEGNAITVICDNLTEKVNVSTNTITNVEAGTGIRIRNAKEATVTGNKVSEIFNNAILLEGNTTGDIAVTDNVLSNWGKDTEGMGRAIRIVKGENTTATITGNAMIHANAPEEFVKISGNTENVNVDENYWNGQNPFAEELFTDDNNYNAYPQSYYAKYDAATNELSELVTISYVAKIGKVQYATLAEAATAAQDGETIQLLWNEGDAAISMAATIVNNKTVTITGRADVDWDKGWLYVGRNGEGNGKLIFKEANLTSKSVGVNNNGLGLNVSCKKEGESTTNDGEVEIINSSIQLDFLIGKGNIKLDNSTLNVYEGFAVGARPADETGKVQRTVTMDITNGSKVIVDNHNGQGLGYESNGIMNIDATSTFETKRSFLITADGTMNVNGGNVKIAGTLTNNGTVYVTGEANLDATVAGDGWFYMNGVNLNADTKLVGAKVGFINGENNIVASTIKDGFFSVGIGQNDAAATAEAFAQANGITLGSVTVNVSDNATVYTSTDAAYSGWVGSAYSAADKGVNKYILNINNSLARFGYMHVSKDGEMNVTGQTNNKYEYAGNAVDFYAGTFINNGNVTLNGVDAWAQYTKISVDHADAVLNITNGTKYEANCTTGNVNASTFLYHKAGTVNVDATSSVNIEKATTLVEGAVLNIASKNVIAKGDVTGNGTINLTDLDAKFTAQEGLTVVDLVNNKDYKIVYEESAYQFVQKDYVAQIDEDNKFETLQEAFDAAEDGDEIVVLKEIVLTAGVTVAADKVVTLNLNDNTVSMEVTEQITANNALITNRGKLTIKGGANNNGKISYYFNGTADRAWAYAVVAISNQQGELIIDGGTIESLSTVTNVYKFTIDNLTNGNGGDAKLVVNGGTIKAAKGGSIRGFANSTTNENIVVIESGNITGQVWMQDPNTDANKGTMTINGGTITANAEDVEAIYLYGNGNASGMNVTIGGDVIVNGRTYLTSVATTDAFTASITGGTFNDEVWVGTWNSNDEFTNIKAISGGIFSVDPSEYCAENYGAFPYDENSWVVREISGEQTFELIANWNWVSSYITEFDGEDGLKMLVNELGENGKQIKNNKASLTYSGSYYGWSGSLSAVSVKEMYKINVVEGQTFKYNGSYVNYDLCDIPLYKGWNYIGYPVNEEMPLADALANLDANVGDMIKAQNGTAIYTEEGWLSSDLTTLVPGEGYMYENTSDQIKVLRYTTKKSSTTSETNTRSSKHWTVDATQYPSNMTMIAMTDVEGGNYEVAAFVNGEVRGSSRPVYVESLDAYILILTISGDDVEEMTFKCYDLTTGEKVEFSNRINYSNDAIVGSIYEPYMLTRGTTGIGEAVMSNVNIYPNPTTTGTEINLEATCDKVEVFNALGVKVVEYQNVDSIDALETAGIYVIRITNNGNVQNCRLVVK